MAAIPLLDAQGNQDEDKGPLFLVLTCILAVCSLTSTCLRCAARVVRRNLGWDDYLIATTAVLTIFRTGLQIASIKHGNGKHGSQLTEEDRQWVVMHTWYTQLILFPTLCLLKCSICLLLLRVKDTYRTKLAIYIIMAVLIASSLQPFVILLAECSPPKTYWDPTAGTCWNPAIRIYSIHMQVACSMITDLICAAMPMYVVLKIKLAFNDKLLLCGLTALGLVATACAIVRASSLGAKVYDIAYDFCITAIWANAELHLGIISANAACGRQIYSVIRYGRVPSANNSRYTNSTCTAYTRSFAVSTGDQPGTLVSDSAREATIVEGDDNGILLQETTTKKADHTVESRALTSDIR
ncbi:hypothetical protein AJ79_08778 [Helicocarpus griseus UAMH5409]|uniref:Rhodopsin domain-containing protein n=1 Tax=Helicocarpus griseus UAMH5409 TaxID=1447875 RepID=A0A2B7WH78_9EURO|nr:hypothetical protein AJ79_08778 [Helicocarpus griseus UAMH5409]